MNKTIQQLIQKGEGYDVVLALYELIKRHSGMIDPAYENQLVASALEQAREVAVYQIETYEDQQGVWEEMASWIEALATVLPPEIQPFEMLSDEDIIFQLSREALHISNEVGALREERERLRHEKATQEAEAKRRAHPQFPIKSVFKQLRQELNALTANVELDEETIAQIQPIYERNLENQLTESDISAMRQLIQKFGTDNLSAP